MRFRLANVILIRSWDRRRSNTSWPTRPRRHRQELDAGLLIDVQGPAAAGIVDAAGSRETGTKVEVFHEYWCTAHEGEELLE